jgi:hypothetical protein
MVGHIAEYFERVCTEAAKVVSTLLRSDCKLLIFSRKGIDDQFT